MKTTEFRKELTKIMPGYNWTVHQSKNHEYMEATGTQSSGFNRISTLRVTRREHASVRYEVKSAGYGLRAEWLYSTEDGTLARALRNLQNYYEHMANNYNAQAAALKIGRVKANA